MLPTRQSTTRYCKEEMVVLGLVHLLGDFLFEAVGGFECRDVVSRDNYRGVLADVPGCFLRSLLDDKRPKATEVHVLTM